MVRSVAVVNLTVALTLMPTDFYVQLKTTTNHIHNIFNVPTAVKETQELIQQDRLLEAHRK